MFAIYILFLEVIENIKRLARDENSFIYVVDLEEEYLNIVYNKEEYNIINE